MLAPPGSCPDHSTHLEYRRRCSASDATFELDYAYTKEGLLEVEATLVQTHEVFFSESVSSFSTTGITPEAAHLMTLLGAPRRSARLSTHPPDQARRVSGYSRVEAWQGLPGDSAHRAARGRRRFAVLEQGVAVLQRRYPRRDIHVVVDDATLRRAVAEKE
ncbi:hypothetical protein [Streptomyces sp. NPDC096142]|uniref:hypothetical protein n=1 Tax=Streptomyces sp. NPDC096142 TaxID=3366077 RepID=UPI0038053503